ncbi:MAG: VOC family protein [Acidobacteria bacterium]|nr:VOC family protein [Acidobacteriota bacterium]
MSANKIAHLELPSVDVAALKKFYSSLFGWTFQDYCPNYVALEDAGLDGGFNADSSHNTKAPLAIVETSDLEAMEKKVREAGGTITLPIFAYPGGRRFHFRDPQGNELAVMQSSH